MDGLSYADPSGKRVRNGSEERGIRGAESGTSRYCGGRSFAGSGRTWMSMTIPLSSLATAASQALSDMRTDLRSPFTGVLMLNEIRSRETSDNSSANSF